MAGPRDPDLPGWVTSPVVLRHNRVFSLVSYTVGLHGGNFSRIVRPKQSERSPR
jgi:hypothetical protein